MYYVKWHGPLRGIQHPYMTDIGGLGHSPWACLAQAKSFSSRAEIITYLKGHGCLLWLDCRDATIIFIHPLNFEGLNKRSN